MYMYIKYPVCVFVFCLCFFLAAGAPLISVSHFIVSSLFSRASRKALGVTSLPVFPGHPEVGSWRPDLISELSAVARHSQLS